MPFVDMNLTKGNFDKAKRIEYLDFCKVFAMFMVTMAHCAQRLSGESFPTLLVSKDSFISVNMAIFMTASGFVMNIEKMKATATRDYVLSKAFRLLLPMTAWYLVVCLVSKHFSISLYWDYYWYLSALFVCLVTIKVLANYMSRVSSICILSVVLLSLIPVIFLERSCYMIPFLWLGYFLRRFIHRIDWKILVILIALYALLYYGWDVSYSIYVTPFHSWEMNSGVLLAYLFRLVIGAVGSVAFIALSRLVIERKGFSWMRKTAQYGRYTLLFYTMSFVLNIILGRIVCKVNYFITTPGVLDVVAIIITGMMMISMYHCQNLIEKNKWLRGIFLGEKP